MTARSRAVERTDRTPTPAAVPVAPAAPSPTHLGQATAIEQSRAVAEVQAAVVVAQQCPRSITAAQSAMEESCKQMGLAERAFYRYPRAGSTVTGATVHLARELARVWGNVQYGIAELRRNDPDGYSEMQAWAWDVQTNTRNALIFVVPHRRDSKDPDGKNVSKPLIEMRDIYENNTNNGARRLRECIFAILPPWFVEAAKDLCGQTLKDGGGKPLAQRISGAIKAFDELGVRVDQLEQKLGRVRDRWTEHDVAQLTVTYRSIQRGEVTKDEEFPPPRVTAAEITGAGKSRPDTVDEPQLRDELAPDNGAGTRTVSPPRRRTLAAPPAVEASPEPPLDPDEPAATAEPDPAAEPAEQRTITQAQQRRLHALLRDRGMADREVGLTFISMTVGRDVESTKELTRQEAASVIDSMDEEQPAPDQLSTEDVQP